MFSEISQNSQEKFYAEACNFVKKEALAQVFFCEFCEISKNTFSYKTPLVAASASESHRFKSERITFHVLMLGNPRFNVISWSLGTVQDNCFLSLVKEICHDLKNISWYITASVHRVKAHAKLYQKLKKDASYFKSFIKYIVFNR